MRRALKSPSNSQQPLIKPEPQTTMSADQATSLGWFEQDRFGDHFPAARASLLDDDSGHHLSSLGDFFGSPCKFGLRQPPRSPAFGFWLPQRFPPLQLHLLAASRMPRRKRQNAQLIAAVSQVVKAFGHAPVALCYSSQFTLAPLIRAASRLVQVPLLELKVIPPTADVAWFRRTRKQPLPPLTYRLYFSELTSESDSPNGDANWQHPAAKGLQKATPSDGLLGSAIQSPKLDWLGVHLAHQVHVLSLRKGGNLEQAIRSRLQQPATQDLSLRILDAPDLTPPELVTEYRNSGAVRWVPFTPTPSTSAHPPSLKRPTGLPSPSCANLSLDELSKRGTYLCHWTRAPSTRRHHESDSHFLGLLRPPSHKDEQIETKLQASLGQATTANVCDAGALCTLLEIVTSGRIIASRRWTRGGLPAVSLTAQPLTTWYQRRIYRPHLGRWDFEPFGIGLDRKAVRALGGRPVVYGDLAQKEQLPPHQLPWFQLRESTKPKSKMNWTDEREWRVLSDIDLKQFGSESAFVFVPSAAAADLISAYSRWPVLILPQPNP